MIENERHVNPCIKCSIRGVCEDECKNLREFKNMERSEGRYKGVAVSDNQDILKTDNIKKPMIVGIYFDKESEELSIEWSDKSSECCSLRGTNISDAVSKCIATKIYGINMLSKIVESATEVVHKYDNKE